MKDWNWVVGQALSKIEQRTGELQKEEMPRTRLSVAALVYLRTDGRPYVMRDPDWSELENAFLISGYAIVRFGTKHIGLVTIKSVIHWPRVSLIEAEASEG